MSERRQFRPDDDVGYRHEIIPPDEPDCPYLDRRVRRALNDELGIPNCDHLVPDPDCAECAKEQT